MDRNGRYITSLHKADFQILEDGIEQEVAFFAPVEQPFTIFFLLDTSSSMIPHSADLAQTSNGLLSQLRPDDRLIAGSFYKLVDILFQATKVSDLHKDLKLKIRQDSDCSTMIYDAVDYALKYMKKISGRKAIVLFSDGVGTGTFATAKRNLRDAEEEDVLIYTVQFGTFPAEPPRHVNKQAYFKQINEINGYMRDLAQRTGGRHYQVESISDLGKTFGLVADELRTQYSLAYYPKKQLEAGQKRQIKVKVRLPDLVVRSRSSYIIGQSQNAQR
jgi:Ca-activated chloride channel family protein